MFVPGVPLPSSVVVDPLVDEVGLAVFPKILPPLPNGLGAGVDGFKLKKLGGAVPVAGVAEVVPPPNRPPPEVGAVVVVAPKSEPAGLEPKIFAGVVAGIPGPVVPVPVVPVPVAGVAVDVVFV